MRYYEKWYFNGVAIEIVSAYKYIGLFITPKLIWPYAKHNLAAQARKSIISMLKLQSSVGYFEYPELFKLFDTMIKPILLYGSDIWGFEISDTIENVQDNIYKKVFEFTQNTFHEIARGECGRYPLYVDYYCRCIRY